MALLEHVWNNNDFFAIVQKKHFQSVKWVQRCISTRQAYVNNTESIEIDRSVMQSIQFEADLRFCEISAIARRKTYYKIEKSALHLTSSIEF